KYKGRYRSHKRYKANDESNEYKVNEKVVIEEANPMSKDKQWKIIRRAS
ncbi:mitochondrial small ribosomal subunit protein uS17m, partial [Patescibacteria group bacterium]|nr:mitochondrial small ribosomal subunit protein uS17m [Patescibacteria group bacterium]